jgi:hypothetical protein
MTSPSRRTGANVAAGGAGAAAGRKISGSWRSSRRTGASPATSHPLEGPPVSSAARSAWGSVIKRSPPGEPCGSAGGRGDLVRLGRDGAVAARTALSRPAPPRFVRSVRAGWARGRSGASSRIDSRAAARTASANAAASSARVERRERFGLFKGGCPLLGRARARVERRGGGSCSTAPPTRGAEGPFGRSGRVLPGALALQPCGPAASARSFASGFARSFSALSK